VTLHIKIKSDFLQSLLKNKLTILASVKQPARGIVLPKLRPQKRHHVYQLKMGLAAGCIMGNCLLRVDLRVIAVRSLSFCDSKVMCVNVQVRLDVLGSFTA